MKTKLFFLPAAAALLAFASCSALALIVPVAQDTSSNKKGDLTSAAGKATSLTVSGTDEVALLEFDLSNPAVVPLSIYPTNITSVLLNIYIVKTFPSGDLSFVSVTGTWNETFSGKAQSLPAIDSTNVIATITESELPTTGKGFVSVDITAAAVAALESGSNLNIAIESLTAGTKIELGSKDGPAVGYAATLDIETTAGVLSSQNTAIGYQALVTSTLPALSGSYPYGPAQDTAVGYLALKNDTSLNEFGEYSSNTAVGAFALYSNTSGFANTAVGDSALSAKTTGYYNTAVGYGANGYYEGGGSSNTSVGAYALCDSTTSNNTAIGFNALTNLSSGGNNTATGYQALAYGTSGYDNAAFGYDALLHDTNGNNNTAIGDNALVSDTTGSQNTAEGSGALNHNTSGSQNTADGFNALNANTTGNFNTTLGFNAGYHLTTGSNNIDIGDGYSGSSDDAAGETNTIRIGALGTQNATYIAGIYGADYNPNDTPFPVYIDSTGRLGTAAVVPSSRKFKKDIKPMGDASDVLLSLRPVMFQYIKPQFDPRGGREFGLIAEEVDKICPDLVAHNKDGTVFGIRYDAVNAMMLNEFLKEHSRVEDLGRTVAAQAQQIAAQQQVNAAQQKQIQSLTAGMERMTRQMNAVAQRLEGKDYQPVANHPGTVSNQ